MSIPRPFRKQGGGSEEGFRQQSNVETAFGNLSKSVILDGTLLENVPVGTAATNIDHKLGRTYRGYIICKNSTQCIINNTNSVDDSKFITLQASVATTVSIWVF
jgi:hypothetical protein